MRESFLVATSFLLGIVLTASLSAVASHESVTEFRPAALEVWVSHTYEWSEGYRHSDIHKLSQCDQADLDYDGTVQVSDYTVLFDCLGHQSVILDHAHPELQ